MEALAKKINYYLLAFLILIFPLGVITRIDFGKAVAFTLNDIVVGVLAVSLFVIVLLNKKISGELFKPISIFVLCLLLSLILNYSKLNFDQFLISGSYILRLIAYTSIYFSIVLLSKSHKSNLLKLLAVSGFITIIIGYLQLLFYPNLRNLFYAGWDEHLYRIFTTFLDPNFSGIIFVLFFNLLLTTKILERYKIYLLPLISIAIVLTFSRTAVIVFGLSLLVYALSKKSLKIVYVFIIASVIIGSFYFLIPKKESTNFFRTASTFARVEHYKEGFTIFSKNPIFGIGFNSYRYALDRYGFKDKMKYGPSHGASGNDNSFLFILATSGIIGFGSFLYLSYKITNNKVSNANLKKLSLLCVLVSSFFVNALFYVFILEWLLIVLGTTENT